MKDMISGAEFSTCRKYRFSLWRIWDESKPLVMFIGLNPSTANETKPDNTITRVISIAKSLGFGGLYMMNCFPYVSTNPDDMEAFYDTPFHDIEDFKNGQYLLDISKKCSEIIFAWGNFKVAKHRGKILAEQFPQAKALILNKNGSPRHPLYVKGDVIPVIYRKDLRS